MMKIPRRWPVTEAEVDALGPYKGRAPDRTLTPNSCVIGVGTPCTSPCARRSTCPPKSARSVHRWPSR